MATRVTSLPVSVRGLARVAGSWEECFHSVRPLEPSRRHPLCDLEWDGWLCWPPTRQGNAIRQPCPGLPGQKAPQEDYAYRACLQGGAWAETNLSSCVLPLPTGPSPSPPPLASLAPTTASVLQSSLPWNLSTAAPVSTEGASSPPLNVSTTGGEDGVVQGGGADSSHVPVDWALLCLLVASFSAAVAAFLVVLCRRWSLGRKFLLLPVFLFLVVLHVLQGGEVAIDLLRLLPLHQTTPICRAAWAAEELVGVAVSGWLLMLSLLYFLAALGSGPPSRMRTWLMTSGGVAAAVTSGTAWAITVYVLIHGSHHDVSSGAWPETKAEPTVEIQPSPMDSIGSLGTVTEGRIIENTTDDRALDLLYFKHNLLENASSPELNENSMGFDLPSHAKVKRDVISKDSPSTAEHGALSPTWTKLDLEDPTSTLSPERGRQQFPEKHSRPLHSPESSPGEVTPDTQATTTAAAVGGAARDVAMTSKTCWSDYVYHPTFWILVVPRGLCLAAALCLATVTAYALCLRPPEEPGDVGGALVAQGNRPALAAVVMITACQLLSLVYLFGHAPTAADSGAEGGLAVAVKASRFCLGLGLSVLLCFLDTEARCCCCCVRDGGKGHRQGEMKGKNGTPGVSSRFHGNAREAERWSGVVELEP